MHFRQRKGTTVLALALVSTVGCAAWAVAAAPRTGKQAQMHTAAAHSAAPTASSLGSQVAATVNGQPITCAQVADEMIAAQMCKFSASNPMFRDTKGPLLTSIGTLIATKMQARPGQPVSVTRDEIAAWIFKDKPATLYQTVGTMIGEAAVGQAAKKEGLVAAPDAVDAQIKSALQMVRTQYNMPGSDADIEKQIGVNPTLLRPFFRTQYLLQQMVKSDFAKQLGHPLGDADYISARHIIVAVQATPGNPADTEKKFADAKAKIESIAADIKSGKLTFEKAASENNSDSTKFKGGDLGVIVRDQPNFDQDFMKAAFQVPIGQVSPPVRSAFGWHLIRVDKTGKEMTTAEKSTALDTNVVRPLVQAKAKAIVDASHVDNRFPQPQQQMPGMMNMPQRGRVPAPGQHQ